MKLYFTRFILIARLAALALSVLCLLPGQIQAEEMNGYIVMCPSVGLAPGESLRLTLFNPNGVPVRAEALIHRAGGVQVALGDGSVRFIQPGITRSFDINRSDIPPMGEEGTDRLQLRAPFFIGIAEPGTIDRVVVSMETISISDGTSNTVFFSEVIPSAPGGGGGNDVLVGGDARDVLIGFVPGQTLRVTLFNPPSFESETQQNPANGHVKIFDRGGNLIAQSDELVIPRGEFRSFDFNRDALLLPGEPRTGRLQVRAHLEATTDDPSSVPSDPRATSPLVASFEIIDNSTGRTTLFPAYSNQGWGKFEIN